ncbi:MAG: acetyl-CoA carboxylase biotin carboxylase subunit [Phycisphaerales bacterium]|nr:acetyl-CoA carboxylase biotin carboxylase subunit [Phycisphaerales bacterium]
MFQRILIANRGEVALRVIRAARELGIETVCIYSTADRDAPYLALADEAICIGPATASDSYLNIASIIAAAEIANIDAIHPGYGFLAENPDFADVCRSCEIAFIGPSPEAMGMLGNKVACKQLAKKNKVPVFPGSDGPVENEEEAVKLAKTIGYPIIIKAVAGGGGRGMRVANNEASLRTGFHNAQLEAEAAFKNNTVFIEKFLERARHIEVQVIGDSHGNAIHFFERDCSTQRRHQKLIEEAPAPGIDASKRDQLCKAACRMLKAASYCGAATVEFLMDRKQNFGLLEVNTRIQVEHPVSEMITGVDLVKLQILVASGEPIPLKQRDVKLRGHAMECRINAEDPDRDFAPQPGRLTRFDVPGGRGVRVDTHCVAGYSIPPNYDSMIAKLITHGEDREACLAVMRRALDEFHIEPIATTIPLHRQLVRNSKFVKGGVSIHFLERLLKQ